MFGASFRSFAASTALSRTAIQESTGGKTQVKLTLFFEPKPSIDCLQENKEWMVNVCFITFVDSWSSFSHDGTDCDCSSRISTWAAAQGENCYVFIYIVCKLHEVVIQSWTPCHSTSHNSDVGVNLMSFMLVFSLFWELWSLLIWKACWCSSESCRSYGRMIELILWVSVFFTTNYFVNDLWLSDHLEAVYNLN